MKSRLSSALMLFTLSLFTLAFDLSDETGLWAQDTIDFNADVRPLLNEHCVACHGGVRQAADLSFVYEDQTLAMVEPGDPEGSELMSRILLGDDDDSRMPPVEHGRGLDEEEQAVIRRWIEQGAKWGKHWSFVPPKKYLELGDVDSTWPRTKIDPFVLAGLSQYGLNPNEDAAPERWLRRVSLDLVGLPPSIEQTKDFVQRVQQREQSKKELVYANEVDRLLSDSSFGERWGSVWLDSIRYADSRGLGLDSRRSIWKYRDWVIRSINDDLPYDQFAIKQLAGDLLAEPTMDDLLATASQRLTQTNEEGGTDDEMFRVEAVIDRVNTTWQAFQGLSFSCVQCHSHPYEPIRHEEYYQFMAYFNNTVDCDISNDAPNLAVPIDDADFSRARELDRELNSLVQKHWQSGFAMLSDGEIWDGFKTATIKTNNKTRARIVESDSGVEFATDGTVSKNTTFQLNMPMPEELDSLTAIRFTGMPVDEERAKRDSEWGFVLSHVSAKTIGKDGTERKLDLKYVIADEPFPLYDPQASLNEKNSRGFGAYSRIHFPRMAAFVLASPVEVKSGDSLCVSIKQNVLELGAFPLVSKRGKLEFSDELALTDWLSGDSTTKVINQVTELKSQRKAIESVPTPVMAERPARFARPTHLFDRGDYLTKTDLVSAEVPDFLSRDSAMPTRLDMANWIASLQNPLTARVAVNRVWAEFFGIGIVETQEDFGSSGTWPSHAELLDDLAARFQSEMKWSLKTLIREIALSSAYRQSAKITPEKLVGDPRNRLLSRGPKIRLPAETIRDQSLFISGLLNRKQFGPPVHPPLPNGVWKPFNGADKWETPSPEDSDRYRTSIYTYTKRSIPYPVMVAFDAPSREFCSARRQLSNTPLQSLMTFNDATFVEATVALGLRMQNAEGELDDQLRFGFQLAVCREPTEQELKVLSKLWNRDAENKEKNAFANVASVLLNLDEVLSK